jgi:hypothetical protein
MEIKKQSPKEALISWSSLLILSIAVLYLLYSVCFSDYSLGLKNIFFLLFFCLILVTAYIKPTIGRLLLWITTLCLSVSWLSCSTAQETVSYFVRIGSLKIATPDIDLKMLALFIWCTITNLDMIRLIITSIQRLIYYGIED